MLNGRRGSGALGHVSMVGLINAKSSLICSSVLHFHSRICWLAAKSGCGRMPLVVVGWWCGAFCLSEPPCCGTCPPTDSLYGRLMALGCGTSPSLCPPLSAAARMESRFASKVAQECLGSENVTSTSQLLKWSNNSDSIKGTLPSMSRTVPWIYMGVWNCYLSRYSCGQYDPCDGWFVPGYLIISHKIKLKVPYLSHFQIFIFHLIMINRLRNLSTSRKQHI